MKFTEARIKAVAAQWELIGNRVETVWDHFRRVARNSQDAYCLNFLDYVEHFEITGEEVEVEVSDGGRHCDRSKFPLRYLSMSIAELEKEIQEIYSARILKEKQDRLKSDEERKKKDLAELKRLKAKYPEAS